MENEWPTFHRALLRVKAEAAKSAAASASVTGAQTSPEAVERARRWFSGYTAGLERAALILQEERNIKDKYHEHPARKLQPRARRKQPRPLQPTLTP